MIQLLDATSISDMTNMESGLERKPGTFGSATGPDPVASGAKSKPKLSLVAAIKKRLALHPELLDEMAASMTEAASKGDAVAVNALRTLLDRLDGPVAVQLDVRTDTSRLLLQGETLDMVPAMPDDVLELEADANGTYAEPDPDAIPDK